MGEVKRLLFSEPLTSASPAMYADKRSIESAETMHVHERNVRLEYTPAEMVDLMWALRVAFERNGEFRLALGDQTEYLSLRDIAAESGVTPTRFEVEESTYPTLSETTIHVHYRNLRLEFTHAEWEEFSAGIATASKEWRNG